MIMSLIVAMDTRRVIGKANQLPWHLPADLQHFKKITLGKPIIMGRKTYESIGRPLPGRRNVVISRQENFRVPGCDVFSSLVDALDALTHEPEVMVIGGANIFEQALPLADRLFLTIIHEDFEGDTFFPEWSEAEWKEVASETHEPDEKNVYSYTFLELRRVL